LGTRRPHASTIRALHTHTPRLKKILQELSPAPFSNQRLTIIATAAKEIDPKKSLRRNAMINLQKISLAAASTLTLAFFSPPIAAAGRAAAGPIESPGSPYRVLAPIQSGNLLLFPIVRSAGKSPSETPFITLDEGIRSGEVEVTEAGRVQGLVRPRDGHPLPSYRGDQVNTLVLVNKSSKPLLLLAGEIVTGGKQDRVIAKDRIVPSGADPIDLSVFCIEPGRWTGSSAAFGAASKAPSQGFMVQPAVRQRAMADKDQQQVWNSVGGAISQMEMATAAAPPPPGPSPASRIFPSTTSYAKVMQSDVVSKQVDEAAAPIINGREDMLARLREQYAIGVVVAIHGEIIWADLFANTDLLARYWTKLVRSYAAESLTGGGNNQTASATEAQRFLEAPTTGTETSEGAVNTYRYRELKSSGEETFILESFLPGTGYDVHISKMKLRSQDRISPKPHPINEPQIYR
jgi:hypothetical protein